MAFDGVGGGAAVARVTADRLGAWWPEARRRLVDQLCAQGVDPATAEEAVAEAATRALARGLPAADLDDFCRWAFVVARNLVFDAGRRSRRLVPLESLIEQPDRYDIGRHVEMRQRWRETARALRSLSATDRDALLATLGSPQPADRREAVREAVRRHRARDRLRAAVGQAGAFLGWVKRPREWMRPVTPFLARDDVAALVMVALLAISPGVGAIKAVEPAKVDAHVAAPSAPLEQPVVDGRKPAPSAQQSSHRPAAATKADVAAAVSDGAVRGYDFSFTPSPDYEDDSTVFAAGAGDDCDELGGRCPILLKSTDRGASWTPLPAEGRDFGTILLPPAYPRDPRIFSAGLTFSVSTDGGQTFRVIGPSAGPATMSPLFSTDDPRIVFGTDPVLRSVTAMQYRDGTPTLTPLSLPLPIGAVALQLWFGGGPGAEGPMFVAASESLTALAEDRGSEMLDMTTLSRCSASACTRVMEIGMAATPPTLAWSTRDPQVLFVGTPFGLYRSADGGATFAPLDVPGQGPRRLLTRLVTAPGGKLFASVAFDSQAGNRLYVSDDDGRTWQLRSEGEGAFYQLTALPDGTLLDGTYLNDGTISCSVDGGATWARSCRR